MDILVANTNIQDIQVESFATWMLLGQLALSSVVQSAMSILPKDIVRDKPDVAEVSHRAPNLSRNCAAYHVDGDKRIYILTDTDVYHSAKSGDPESVKYLASIIAHENVHVHGGGEREAYGAQIQVLKKLGAKPSTIQDVQRAAKSILNKST